MEASECAFDRIKEAFELVAQDEAEKMSIVQEIMFKSADYLRRIIAPVGNSFPLEDYVWSLGEKDVTIGGVICGGRKYDWKQPARLLVVQTGESVNQAKVFKAHAVPQGLCGNLMNALKLRANQQENETASYGTL